MARRKRTRRRSYPRRAYARVRRRYRRHKVLAGSTGYFAGGVGYGVGRSYLNGAIKPFLQKIPFGEAGDNIGMGLALHFIKKFAGRRIPFISNVCNAGLAVEGAMLGEELKAGKIGFNTSTTNGGALW